MRSRTVEALVVALTFLSCSCSHAALLEPPPVSTTQPTVEIVRPTQSPSPTPTTLLVLPPAPMLTAQGHDLILEFETGGKSGYDPHPEWPGGASGVTIGIGYDLGYNLKSIIESDWHEIEKSSRDRLIGVAGFTGSKARDLLWKVRDIFIVWRIALGVFDNVDVAREWAGCRKDFPGFVDLRPNAQAALISLRFNRGGSMIGRNREEMREIQRLVPKQDYGGIAQQLRKMVRVWEGTDIENGMRRRRYAEAKLVETF